jgi:hypothetical protein
MDKSGERYSVLVAGNEIIVNYGMRVPTGGTKGKVVGMSKKSQSALMHFINSVEFRKAVFVTLTYRYNQQDNKRAYGDLRAWHKRLCYEFGDFCIVWKAELQERGAYHYHVFALDPPASLKKDGFRDAWLQTTRQDGDTACRRYGCHTKTIDTLEQDDAGVIISYLAKYTAKEGASTSGKAWGILGRRFARQEAHTFDGDKESTGRVMDSLVAMGAKRYELTNGGVQYRLYLGHVGTIGRPENDSRICAILDEVTRNGLAHRD